MVVDLILIAILMLQNIKNKTFLLKIEINSL